MDPAGRRLAALRRAGLERVLRVREGRELRFTAGRRLKDFCSNDYLGLAGDPRLARSVRRAVGKWGWGAGAARLVTGTFRPHAALEEALAAYHGRSAALLFGTGYQANVGVLQGLVRRGDRLLSDARNHASLIDGCRLSGAGVEVYRHADMDHLASLLKGTGRRRRWIVTDAVFSVDGDVAPLREIVRLAYGHGAGTIVDEAHAVGVWERGLVHALGLSDRVDAVVGTLSKALGGVGGWASGTGDIVRLLRNTARSFMFTTAPPPAAAEAALEALRICRSREGDLRRERLWANVRALREGLGMPPPQSPITPIAFRGVASAGKVSRRLERKGFYVAALRPPTVPKGTSRLRITASAAQTPAEVAGLVRALTS